jgi:hypothetical protein
VGHSNGNNWVLLSDLTDRLVEWNVRVDYNIIMRIH